MTDGNRGDDRFAKIKARYAGRCADADCAVRIAPGDEVWYDVERRKVYCADCAERRMEDE